MRKQHSFQIKGLAYLEEALTLNGTYSANSIDAIVDSINQIYNNLTKCEMMLSNRHSSWYKENNIW